MRESFYEILGRQGIPIEGFIDMLYDQNIKGALSPPMREEYKIKNTRDYFEKINPMYWITEAFEPDLTPQGAKFWTFVDNLWQSQIRVNWGEIKDGILYVEPVSFDEKLCSRLLGGCLKDETRFEKFENVSVFK